MKSVINEPGDAPEGIMMETLNRLEDAVQERTAEVAYGLAEQQGFVSGEEQRDWREAQRQVADEVREDLGAIRSDICQCITLLEQALHQRIAEVAYGIAQERSFAPGHEMDDWRAAEDQVEAEIQAMLPAMAEAQGRPVHVEIPMPHNEVEKGWENPAEVEMPAMNPD